MSCVRMCVCVLSPLLCFSICKLFRFPPECACSAKFIEINCMCVQCLHSTKLIESTNTNIAMTLVYGQISPGVATKMFSARSLSLPFSSSIPLSTALSKPHLHVHVKLREIFVYDDIWAICRVQIRTSFEYETDSDTVAWASTSTHTRIHTNAHIHAQDTW